MPSFVAAMNATFRNSGQPLGDFSNELKALSNEDRKWYSDALNEAGIEHEPPTER